jgi:Fe-S-cluster containining protein
MSAKKKGNRYRISFPKEEKANPWMSDLLDCHALVDEGVALAIEERTAEEGVTLACRRGCDSCCRSQRDIPVYPHELMGIYWYCVEKIKQPTREVLRHQFTGHGPEDPCPFLMSGACAIHPVRPAGCRQFNVFVRPCEEGEDPFHSRREDVLTPRREYTHRAFSRVLSLYGGGKKEDRPADLVEKVIRTQVVNLQTYDWKKLAARMKEHDEMKKRPSPPSPDKGGEGTG